MVVIVVVVAVYGSGSSIVLVVGRICSSNELYNVSLIRLSALCTNWDKNLAESESL